MFMVKHKNFGKYWEGGTKGEWFFLNIQNMFKIMNHLY